MCRQGRTSARKFSAIVPPSARGNRERCLAFFYFCPRPPPIWPASADGVRPNPQDMVTQPCCLCSIAALMLRNARAGAFLLRHVCAPMLAPVAGHDHESTTAFPPPTCCRCPSALRACHSMALHALFVDARQLLVAPHDNMSLIVIVGVRAW